MKGFKTLNVKKDTYEMITDLGTSGMSQDDVIKMLIRNSAELRDAKQEIERLKKELRASLGTLRAANFAETKNRFKKELGLKDHGEVMEAEAGRE